MKKIFCIFALAFAACSSSNDAATDHLITVSIPVQAFFIDRLAGDVVDVNVMIPQAAGHSDYNPRPSQMMALAEANSYFAVGDLDFEITWKDRIISANPNILWKELNAGITHIEGHEHGHAEEKAHHHALDPHYFLSPKQAKVMAENYARELKKLLPSRAALIDTSLVALTDSISRIDEQFTRLTKDRNIAFMIYHPALGYLARDYGMTQLAIEHNGNAPAPSTFIAEIDSARSAHVGVVFVQQGYDMQKAQTAADEIGAKVVSFAPESYDWFETMNIILLALQ